MNTLENTTQAKRAYVRRPKALREARKLAESARGGHVSYSNIWLRPASIGGGLWRVNYKVPKCDGWFTCHQLLFLTPEEVAEADAFSEGLMTPC